MTHILVQMGTEMDRIATTLATVQENANSDQPLSQGLTTALSQTTNIPVNDIAFIKLAHSLIETNLLASLFFYSNSSLAS